MLALPVLGLAGAVAVLAESAVTESLQDGVADEHRSGALGLGDAVMVSCAMAGSLVAPLLASAIGARSALVLLGSTCLVAVLPAVGRVRHHRSRPDDRVSEHLHPSQDPSPESVRRVA
jgi:hypothetical protein